MWTRAIRVTRPALRPLIGTAAPLSVSAPRLFATPTPARLASLAVIFDKWDVDKSATLDLEEIKSGLKELDVPHSDASIAKLFLDLCSRDEYDDEIPLEEKVVSLTEWFDNLPDKLADEIISRSKAMGEAPETWRPYVQKTIDDRLGSKEPKSTLSPLIMAFREWDKDDSKTLDLDEIKSGLTELGIKHDTKAVEKLFKSLCMSDEYDEVIDLDQKVVSIAEWLDKCPVDLKIKIYDAAKDKLGAKLTW
jgi:Ca2+-binding EF-hand superfamily protein